MLETETISVSVLNCFQFLVLIAIINDAQQANFPENVKNCYFGILFNYSQQFLIFPVQKEKKIVKTEHMKVPFLFFI